MGTARERAISFLHGQVESAASHHSGEIEPERVGRISGVIGALSAVGLISAGEAEDWRTRLTAVGETPVVPSLGVRGAGAELLGRLLDSIPPEDDGTGTEFNRFEGALHALEAIHAAEPGWDDRMRSRLGWPSRAEELTQMRILNAGGTERDLVAVVRAPASTYDGLRVLYALRFGDGITLVVWHEASSVDDISWEVELVDDLRTHYSLAHAGGGDGERRLSFVPAPPAVAQWVELRRAVSAPIRIRL